MFSMKLESFFLSVDNGEIDRQTVKHLHNFIWVHFYDAGTAQLSLVADVKIRFFD